MEKIAALLSAFDAANAAMDALAKAIHESDASDNDKAEALAQIEGNGYAALGEAQAILDVGLDAEEA